MSENATELIWEQAESKIKQQDWEEAIMLYQALLDSQPNHPFIHERLAWLNYKCAHFGTSIYHFQLLANHWPDQHPTLKEHFMLGLQYFLQLQLGLAIVEHLAAAKYKLTSLNLNVEPTFPEYKPQEAPANLFCEYLLSIGTYQLALEKYTQVRHISHTILRLEPTHALAKKLNQDTTVFLNNLWEQALELHRQGHLPEAEIKYLFLLKQHPHHHEALHGLGLLRWQMGNTVQAIPLLQQALIIAPENTDYQRHLEYLLAGQSDSDVATMVEPSTI